jgi:hypothetical protein
MVADPADVRRELQAVERAIADATAEKLAELASLEGQRDKLLARLLDSAGCPDSRFTARY